MRRVALASVVAMGVLLLGAGPAAPPDRPVKFIHVDELKAVLDRGVRVDIIDVRHWDSYVQSHIKGARSMPIRTGAERASEITKTGRAVFY